MVPDFVVAVSLLSCCRCRRKLLAGWLLCIRRTAAVPVAYAHGRLLLLLALGRRTAAVPVAFAHGPLFFLR